MSAPPLVEMRNIYKSFGGTHAVEDVSVTVQGGEVLGVVGHNGAGKSTLIKILAGAYRMDSGEIYMQGEKVSIHNPRDARDLGIETLYQDLALADHLDAVANLFLGREIMTRWATLDGNAMEKATREVIARINPNFVNLREPVQRLSGGQRQSVAIGRALYFDTKVLIMDEPTAALGHRETSGLQGAGDPAQVRGDRHGPDLPRHPRRVRSVGPDHGDDERPPDRHPPHRRGHQGPGAEHDHSRQAARRGDRRGHRDAALT